MQSLLVKTDLPEVKIIQELQSFGNQDLQEISASFLPDTNQMDMRDCAFFRLTEVSYDDEYPRREAFENVLATLDNPSFNFVYLINGNPEGIEIYLGIVRNYKGDKSVFKAADVANDILQASLQGNFQGSRLKKLDREEISTHIFNKIQTGRRSSLITGIPSINKDDSNQNIDFQGIDRLINSMAGTTWQFLVVCEPMDHREIDSIKNEVYQLYNEVHQFSKISVQHSESTGSNFSTSKGQSDSRSKSIGVNESKGKSSGSGHSSGSSSTNSGTTSSRGTNNSSSTTTGSSSTTTKGKNDSLSNSLTLELVNKQTAELLEYMNDELLERLKLGKGKGLFKTAIYAMAQDYLTQERLQLSIMSIFQGNTSSFSPLRAHVFPEGMEKEEISRMLCHFQTYETPLVEANNIPLLYSQPIMGRMTGLCSFMTAQEVSLIAGLPIKEVPGLSLKEGVDFGLNPKSTHEGIELGYLLFRGRELKKNKIMLDKGSLNKHTFIAGVTGSGKTTTCQKLLIKSDLPFMVIEPAKTEYRAMFEEMQYIQFYTLGNEQLSPFRINPFELLPNEMITAHIDMLKATFTAVFPMEAAMPQILEAAIYDVYQKFGWNFETNQNEFCNDPWDQNGLYFPTFSDLIESLKMVVRNQGFGDRLQADYIGSLVSRVSNLTIGSKGTMLNCKKSIDFMELLDKKVVFEMEDIRSPEDKALIMGFILTRLTEALKRKHRVQSDFLHVTLIEEAHRLLSRVEPGESGSKKLAVEMFADMLAEVRKYGEGLIIVDQIPNKLSPEVLKNTNTKIIHKLFAKDDKDAVGDTMALNEQQREFLSQLAPGEAIVFSQNWHQSVHIQVVQETNTTGEPLNENIIAEQGRIQLLQSQTSFFPALAFADLCLNRDQLGFYKRNRNTLLKHWSEFANKGRIEFKENKQLLALQTFYKKIHEDLKVSLCEKMDCAISYEIMIFRGADALTHEFDDDRQLLVRFFGALRSDDLDTIKGILEDSDLNRQLREK